MVKHLTEYSVFSIYLAWGLFCDVSKVNYLADECEQCDDGRSREEESFYAIGIPAAFISSRRRA